MCALIDDYGLGDVETAPNAAVQGTTTGWDEELLYNTVCVEACGL